MGSIGSFISQCYPPKPTFTEKNLPNLKGKVYLVTGANTGLGKEVAQMLYAQNGKVFVAARSKEKALEAIDAIKRNAPNSTGILEYLHLDLADCNTIKASAQDFLSKEKKLHVLFNNAGIMNPAPGSKTAQGHELQLGTNNVGTFLFTKLLTPTLVATAKTEPASSVRVVWVSSSAAEGMAPKGGVEMGNLDYHDQKGSMHKYAVSKAGNYFQATEFARRFKTTGVVSVPLNPGNLDSELWRTQGSVMSFILKSFVLHPRILGAYTELFAGLSPKVTIEKTGEWVVPWGRYMDMSRKDLVAATKSAADGGTGIAQQFWDWNEAQVKSFL